MYNFNVHLFFKSINLKLRFKLQQAQIVMLSYGRRHITFCYQIPRYFKMFYILWNSFLFSVLPLTA